MRKRLQDNKERNEYNRKNGLPMEYIRRVEKECSSSESYEEIKSWTGPTWVGQKRMEKRYVRMEERYVRMVKRYVRQIVR